MPKHIPGIRREGEGYIIDKVVLGTRIYARLGACSADEAQTYLARRIEEVRQAKLYGVRPKRLWRDACTKYLNENMHKASLHSDASRMKMLEPYIGRLTVDQLHMGTLQPFIQGRRKDGVKARTINHGLKVVSHILKLAASEWMDENGLTWLATAPKIRLLPEPDQRKPCPITWDEQARLFQALPAHLARMALFMVNTGCRDHEVCALRWDWEVRVRELDTIVFIIPAGEIKNRHDKLIVLNTVARRVVEDCRGEHREFVFTYAGHPITRMNNHGFRTARLKAGLPNVRVHDLRHTFGRRLRAAGVSFEDRQDLLGHKSGRITTHYSAPELVRLIEAAELATERRDGPELTVMRLQR